MLDTNYNLNLNCAQGNDEAGGEGLNCVQGNDEGGLKRNVMVSWG